MFKFLKFATAPIRHPVRVIGIAALAVIGAVTLGEQVAPFRHAVGHLLGLVSGDSLAAFRPDTAADPVKEIEFLHSLDKQVTPGLVRARTLLRKRRAEIEYVRELDWFLERRIPDNELAKLRAAVQTGDAVPEKLDTASQTWFAHQRRIQTLEGELEQLMLLEARVTGLCQKLDQRRKETQGLVVEPAAALSATEPAVRRTTEMGEAEKLLSDVHERLFKALFTLSPSLVEE